MTIRERKSGNEAVAIAMRQINPDVVGAFPITPSTEIPRVLFRVRSERRSGHGVHSCGIRAQRNVHLYWSFSCRCPCHDSDIILRSGIYVGAAVCVSIHETPYRDVCSQQSTVPALININNDHSDSMGARDSGWIQMYAETNQEAYDNCIQGVLIAERVQTSGNGMPGWFHNESRSFEYRAASKTRKYANSSANICLRTTCSSMRIRWRVGPADLPLLYGNKERTGSGNERFHACHP